MLHTRLAVLPPREVDDFKLTSAAYESSNSPSVPSAHMVSHPYPHTSLVPFLDVQVADRGGQARRLAFHALLR